MDMNYKGTVMHIGAAPAEEQIYCYSTSDEAQENACIGHLRGDFGTDGEGFFTSWTPHTGKIMAEEAHKVFCTELDHVVSALRENGLLKDRATMAKHIARWQEARIPLSDCVQLALCIETQRRLFYLRCNPMRGEYNFYLYAYRKAALMEVQRKAKNMPEFCNTRLRSTGEPIAIKYGVPGYIPLKSLTGSKEEIDKRIAELNQYHGADKAQIAAMEAGSLFGWHIPAANPNMYDENGLPRKRKKENHRDEQTRLMSSAISNILTVADVFGSAFRMSMQRNSKPEFMLRCIAANPSFRLCFRRI